ncbi:MAG: hypothetical protein HWN79_10115 [Candidatus Lokiarchaeota archaeon]|nr:hypothetical protein [Candidatus Lokiarchaeota archaeon]
MKWDTASSRDNLFGGFNDYATTKTNRKYVLGYTRANFPDQSDSKYTYFKRIEDCLNYAICYCAEAINLTAANFVDCNCGGESKA